MYKRAMSKPIDSGEIVKECADFFKCEKFKLVACKKNNYVIVMYGKPYKRMINKHTAPGSNVYNVRCSTLEEYNRLLSASDLLQEEEMIYNRIVERWATRLVGRFEFYELHK